MNRIVHGMNIKEVLKTVREADGYYITNTARDLSQSDFKNRILLHTDLPVLAKYAAVIVSTFVISNLMVSFYKETLQRMRTRDKPGLVKSMDERLETASS